MKGSKIKKFMYALDSRLLHIRDFLFSLPRLNTQKSVLFCFGSKADDVGYLECSVSIAKQNVRVMR